MTHSRMAGGKRFAALAGVAALTLTGFAGTAIAADADPVQPNLNANATATVTFHKLAGDPTASGNHNGAPWTPGAANTPIAGAKFKLEPIACAATLDGATTAVNLDADTGWKLIQGLKAAKNEDGSFQKDAAAAGSAANFKCKTIEAGAVTTDATGADGTVTLSSVAHTAYYVTEEKPASVETAINPFILTVPLAYTPAAGETQEGYTTAGWLYKINIYPKNKINDNDLVPTKTPKIDTVQYALPDGTVVTDPQAVKWELSLPVTQGAQDDTTGKYTVLKLVDALPNTLGYVSYSDVKLDGTALDAGDYTVVSCTDATCATTGELAAYVNETNPGSTVIKLELTSTGLAKLTAGSTVTFTLNTRVREANVTPTAGSVKNTATYTLGDQDPVTVDKFKKDDGSGTTTDEDSQLNYGTIDVDKYLTGSKATKLAGAKFQLWHVDDSAEGTIPGRTEKGSMIGEVTYDTVASGHFAAPIKVYLGDGADVSEKFILIESAAPAGYQLKTINAYEVFFDAQGAKVVEVDNARRNIDPSAGLPITGAQGLVLLTLGGAAIVLIGVGSVMVVRRRQAQD